VSFGRVLACGRFWLFRCVILAGLEHLSPHRSSQSFYYLFHRLQHTVRFLWRFHKVHHSIREMSAWNSYHHFTEKIFRIPFIAVPLSLIISPDAGHVPAAVTVILGMQALFEHSSTRVNLGSLRYLIADNRYHRIHHSIDPRHHGKNFGSFTSVWDQVFGTAHFPKPSEWPETGVFETAEPKRLRDFLFMPFRGVADYGRQLASAPLGGLAIVQGQPTALKKQITS
jgi:sterol desaturase/sphingolipid hydroxylase (fatty acid hydroxylase superfamily)